MKLFRPSRRLFLARAALAAPALITCPKLLEAGWQSRDSNYNQNVAASGGLGLQTNLSAFFELNNSLADSTGTVTNLTNNNTVTFTTDTPGATGQQCAVFVAASSQSLSHANSSNLAIGGADFSLSVWTKFGSGFGASGRLINQETTAFPQQGWDFGTKFTSGNIFTGGVVNNNSGVISADAATFGSLSTSVWYLTVFRYNATSRVASISVNAGAFDSSAALGINPSGETAQFNIGTDRSVGSFFDGRMCRVGIWKSRLLSAGDVTALYNSGAGLTYAQMA